jgi:hypothetical protein
MINLKHTIIAAAALSLLASAIVGCGDKGGKLATIAISPTEAMIAKGTQKQFTATATFSNGTALNWSSAASWSTSNESAVTISNDFGSYGMATALLSANTDSVSTFIITATDIPNNISGKAILTVVDPVSLTITPANPFMAINTGHQFTAEALLSTGTPTVTQNLTSHVTWTTTDRSIATVSKTGYVTTGANAGLTDIKITYSSLSTAGTGTLIESSTLLTVTGTRLDELIVTAATYAIGPNDSVQFSADGTLAEEVTTRPFTRSVQWSSSDTQVARISNESGSEGLVTAGTGTGSSNITAIDPITGIISDSKKLTVQ